MYKSNVYQQYSQNRKSFIIVFLIWFYNYLSDTLTFIVNLLGQVRFKKNVSNKILVVRGGGIGDIFLIYPILIDLRKRNFEVDLFLLSYQKPVFYTELFKKKYFRNLITLHVGKFQAMKFIACNDYAKVLLFNQSNDLINFTLKRFIALKVINFNSVFIISPITVIPNGFIRSYLDKYITSKTELSIIISYTENRLKFRSSYSFDVVKSFVDCGDLDDYIVCLLGSSRATNKLSLDSWVKILNSNKSRRICLLGGTSEIDFSESLLSTQNQPNILNFTGKLTLSQSSFLLSRASLVISHDTGLMHIAAALNRDLIVYFSSRDIRGRWYPYTNECATILRSSISCGYCLKANCPHSNICINSLV
jgi:hypothetical protein